MTLSILEFILILTVLIAIIGISYELYRLYYGKDQFTMKKIKYQIYEIIKKYNGKFEEIDLYERIKEFRPFIKDFPSKYYSQIPFVFYLELFYLLKFQKIKKDTISFCSDYIKAEKKLGKMIKNTKESLYILGRSMNSLFSRKNSVFINNLKELISQNKIIKILLLDPNLKYISEKIKLDIYNTLKILKELPDQQNVEIKLMREIPRFNIVFNEIMLFVNDFNHPKLPTLFLIKNKRLLNLIKIYFKYYYHTALKVSFHTYTATELLEKGNSLIKAKKYNKAIMYFDGALEIDPKYKEAWSSKGITLDELARYEEAIKCYDIALEIDWNYKEAWSSKGITLDELARYDEAIRYFDIALEIDPKYKEAWSSKGITLGKLARYEGAIECYDKALEIDPNDAYIWYNKSCVEALKNNRNEALILLKKALVLAPLLKVDAKEDSDFDNIRDSKEFKELIGD